MPLTRCPECEYRPLSRSAARCPRCGAELRKGGPWRKLQVVGAIAAIGAVVPFLVVPPLGVAVFVLGVAVFVAGRIGGG